MTGFDPLPVVTFPDVEAVVTTFLREQLDPAVFVCTAWPEHLRQHLPLVSATRLGGGVSLPYVLEDSVIDLDVLAATKAAAHDLAQQARAVMFTAQTAVTPGARIYRVVDQTGLVWTPDPVTEIPRYTLTLELRVRPA